MQQSAQFWDNAAAKYAKSKIGDPEAYETTLARTRSYLKAEDQVLELGAGTGTTALHLAASVARYTVSDGSKAMIDIAREKAWDAGATNLDFSVCDITGAPQGPFDVVLAFNLLHLVEDLDGALSSIQQLVKPGGLFISKSLCEPEEGSSWKFRILRMAIPLMQMLGKAPYVAFRRMEDFEQQIRESGFEILETGNYPAKPPSRFVVARRL
ncbi:class I SAM-dependent methyltransferase [Parasedimentitalea maritima]|uniref:Methyltransferase domain-containing protein n=1 Tax=Parasedimentitalea maritima TaxID=2578117 RepID=A0A6A4REP5_9RHOB|nr:class I SAM-dependent methyltransferase [Zongyanglinia marina]KAE9632526.1 methyltransferase domain-containing protein [Zongyanglinia marina]